MCARNYGNMTETCMCTHDGLCKLDMKLKNLEREIQNLELEMKLMPVKWYFLKQYTKIEQLGSFKFPRAEIISQLIDQLIENI